MQSSKSSVPVRERAELEHQLVRIRKELDEAVKLADDARRNLQASMGSHDAVRIRDDTFLYETLVETVNGYVRSEDRIHRRIEHLDMRELTAASVGAARGVRNATWALAAATLVLIVVTALS